MSETEFLQNINSCKGIINKLVSLYASTYEERKDYAQEIIYQAWKSVKNYNGDSKFSTWLYRLALNTLTVLNRNKNIVETAEDLTSFEKINHSPEKNEAEKLYRAIKSLENTEKAIIIMHLDGYSNEEISAFMGVSINHLTVKLHRVKHKIKKLCNNGN